MAKIMMIHSSYLHIAINEKTDKDWSENYSRFTNLPILCYAKKEKHTSFTTRGAYEHRLREKRVYAF